MTAADIAERAPQYDPRNVQDKWLARWAEMDLFRASDDPADNRPRAYVLDMFPYPSGDLHMGHAEAFAMADASPLALSSRVQRAASDRLEAFGLPAENAAIRNNTHPADWTYANIETQAASFRRYAVSSTGHGGCRRATRSTTAGTSGCSCASTSGGWPTARMATSTGARSTRPCWPTSR